MPLHQCLIWPVSPEDIEFKNNSVYSEDAKVSTIVKVNHELKMIDKNHINGFSIVIPDTLRLVVFSGTQAERDECMRMLGESVGKCGNFLMRQTAREQEKYENFNQSPISRQYHLLIYLSCIISGGTGEAGPQMTWPS